MRIVQKTPTGRRQSSAADRLRRMIFCHCRDLGWDETARRAAASGFRRDGKETMQGMKTDELHRMEQHLARERLKEKNAARREADGHRTERLKRHRRVDGETGQFASERARHFMRSLAQSLWGEEWEMKLDAFILRQIKVWIPWYSERFPRRLHWEITEGLKAMAIREGIDPEKPRPPLIPPQSGGRPDSGRVTDPPRREGKGA